MVAATHQETKSGLVKDPFVLCQISRECRVGEVLVQLLPLLHLPTPNWSELVRISRNFRTREIGKTSFF